jgi:anti-anti-sigma factor
MQDHVGRILLNSITDALVALNHDYSLVFMNTSAQRLMEATYGAEAIESGTAVDADHVLRCMADDSTVDALRQGLRSVLDGERARFDLECRWANGGDRCFVVSVKGYGAGTERGVLMRQRDITDRVHEELAVRESEERFRLIAELSSEGLVLTDQGVIIDANTALCELFGYTHEEIIGKSAIELTAPEDRPIAIAHISSGSAEPYEGRGIRKDGSTFPGLVKGRALPHKGKIIRGTTIRDLSAQRQAEEMLRKSVAQEEQIRAQELRLAELSTPLVPITNEIVALPLIGQLDATRAELVMETLLQGISNSGVHTAIIDMTGVRAVDTNVAGAILRVSRAVRLLGADVVITGLSPEVAQTLVNLGVELTGLEVCGTLQDGIVHAMKSSKFGKFR